MINKTAEELKEELTARAVELKSHGALIEKIMGNISTLHSTSDMQNRISLCNQLGKYGLRGLYGGDITDEAFAGKPVNAGIVFNVFSDIWGDPLCRKINEYKKRLREDEGVHVADDLLLTNGPLARKLLTRTITESEYCGLLNGGIPIVTSRGVKYFLPKDD